MLRFLITFFFPMLFLSTSPLLQTLLSITIVSLVPLVGISLFFVREKILRKSLLFLVSFSTGGLLGDVFLHMIPEMAELEGFSGALYILLGGIVFSFVVEKIIHWRHCHFLPADDHEHHHHHPVGLISLLGDAVHNFIDGLVIAGSFLVSLPVGISTTLAVIFHEIPQEIGDFAILVQSGYSRKKALAFNVLSAVTAFAGALLVFAGTKSFGSLETALLPFAAGNFLYIAGSDLIPELHKESRLHQAVLQLLFMVAGIAVMYGLTYLE